MDWSGIFNEIFSVIYNILYFGVIIGMIIIVILDNRNPVKTMAWILVLSFLPLVGLVFYFFFGRSTRRERIISKKSYNRLMKKPMAEFVAQESYELPADQYQVAQLFRNTNQALPFEGNEVDIYTDGYTKLHALIREMMRAKHHIHLEYYIFENDPVGRLVRDVLIEKARQGVEVRLIYDDVGCWHVPNRFFEEMVEAGINARAFLKVRFPLFTSKVNYRNHRKIVVIDGRVGFVGGMNIALRYMRGFDWGIWRDTHVMIKGKAVHGLQTSFLLDWFFVDQTLLTSSKFFPALDSKGDSLAQIVTSEPTAEWKEIMQGLCLAICSAKEYFYIQTPYFLPTEPILAALQTAALAGVDVRLMLPEHADSTITHLASRSYLKDVLKAGVKVFFYQKGFLHSKLMVSDDALSTVGSTNMDFRSFEHNFEVNAFMYDEPTALRMKEIFLQDQRDSIPVYLKNWEKRPTGQKVKESVVRVLSPLL
ncbi:cardiolipin synthetase 2 [Bacteroides luti]|jgi:cardiolipin synthase|uniref:Cardiolipin synthase n=2 Tax=Bacteroides luti TaxID=1297750 RepID=A0A1M5BXP1_9BACE|nr:cardiolipin synthetase 2 [Bacteroides luti]